MSVLIVEDEPVAASALRALIARLAPELDCEPALATVDATLQRLAQAPLPELVFLDVHLADGLCFELFDALPPTLPVIFTTAHDDFVLRAFEVFGIDYLLKPLRPSALHGALDKWRTLRGADSSRPRTGIASAWSAASRRPRERFLVAQGPGWIPIAIDDVAYFRKALVVTLCTRERRAYPLPHSLDELEGMVDPQRFFRVNRQLLVHVDAIGALQRGTKGRIELVLRPPIEQPVVVSQERAAELRAWLER